MRSNWFFAVTGFCLVVSLLFTEPYPTAVAQEGAGRASLTIDLVGFKDTSGKAIIYLFDNENSFKSADMRKDRKEVEKYFRSLVEVPIQVAGNNCRRSAKSEICSQANTPRLPFTMEMETAKWTRILWACPQRGSAFPTMSGLKFSRFPRPRRGRQSRSSCGPAKIAFAFTCVTEQAPYGFRDAQRHVPLSDERQDISWDARDWVRCQEGNDDEPLARLRRLRG